MPRKKQRSPQRIELERRIEAFLYWSVCITLLVPGLMLSVVYFNKAVTHHDFIFAVRLQTILFATAFFCCPLTPIPSWFPLKIWYRFLVFATGLVAIEIVSAL
ncbi:hypothetical protein Cha6605_5972 (plasmid) [Chamaesiphon minutus PCC 6605]|uniref:Uncharacterized protein n=1 Tax=Chamaesiphon minutus (strain ATCC 27169 / PCC 6605) TaxID=1173020 RepID=K9UP09_CHAP6|nr:hypothetical protein Cha6605_5972 [Chamaesiphon minutus PCC 6605]